MLDLNALTNEVKLAVEGDKSRGEAGKLEAPGQAVDKQEKRSKPLFSFSSNLSGHGLSH